MDGMDNVYHDTITSRLSSSDLSIDMDTQDISPKLIRRMLYIYLSITSGWQVKMLQDETFEFKKVRKQRDGNKRRRLRKRRTL